VGIGDQYHQITAGPKGWLVLVCFMSPDYGSVRLEDRMDEFAVNRLPGEKPQEVVMIRTYLTSFFKAAIKSDDTAEERSFTGGY
jgi:hypothetical protein